MNLELENVIGIWLDDTSRFSMYLELDIRILEILRKW